MHRGRNIESAKDFKGAMKRLFKELKSFRIFIILSIVLSVAGAILTILAPDQLSNLTDEISKGLMVNQTNLEALLTNFQSNFQEEKLNILGKEIINLQLNETTTKEILESKEYNESEKQSFQIFLAKLKTAKPEELIQEASALPDTILEKLLPSSTYEGVVISSKDKIALIKNIFIEKNISALPLSIASCLLTEFKIENTTITKEDQLELLKQIPNLNSENPNQIYAVLDKLPAHIQDVIAPSMNIKKITNIFLVLVAFYIISAIFNYIESLSMTHVSNHFAKNLRTSISKKINVLPLKYFDQNQTGDILSRVTNDVDLIAMSMNNSLATLVSAITLFLGTLFMMFVTNFILAITAIGASLFGFIFMFGVLGKSQKYFVRKQKELGNLDSHIEEIYSGLQVVQSYNGVEEALKEFDERNNALFDSNRKSVFLSGLMMPMMNFIGNFGYVCVCVMGAILTMNGQISFGVIVAFISYVRLFTSPLSQIAQAMTNLQSTAAASERVFEFIDEEQMKSEEDKTVFLPKEKVKGNIDFCHVFFQYDGNEKPTIYDFNAKVKKGQKIAIVGPTGAGKTTMVNLLMKFYELTGGDIFIDGINTKELKRENVHSLFTMVLQDTWLFDGTVKENIKYNRENVSDEKVKEVCKTIGLDHFIRTLPNGYDSIIRDSDSVSSGQRQLLTIARGMIEDAPFLILDEATSNVDTRTEELVQKAMDKLMEGRTSFIIAHRLSTIKNADLILVMDHGNIIEQGNHNELMKQNGFYAELYNSQFEL